MHLPSFPFARAFSLRYANHFGGVIFVSRVLRLFYFFSFHPLEFHAVTSLQLFRMPGLLSWKIYTVYCAKHEAAAKFCDSQGSDEWQKRGTKLTFRQLPNTHRVSVIYA